MYNYYTKRFGAEMLRQSQFKLFNEYVSHLYTQDADTGLQAVLSFVQEVFGLYHAQNKTNVKLTDAPQENANNRNKYKQIRFIIALLEKLEKQDASKLEQAFQQAFQNHQAKFVAMVGSRVAEVKSTASRKEKEKEKEKAVDPSVSSEAEEERISLSGFADEVSYLFTSGLFSELQERYNLLAAVHPEIMQQLSTSMTEQVADAIDNVKQGDLYQFIHEALPLISRLENEAAVMTAMLQKNPSGDNKDGAEEVQLFIAGSAALGAAFRACVNQAIYLLDPKNNVSRRNVSREDKEKSEHLIVQVNNAFLGHIQLLVETLLKQHPTIKAEFDVSSTYDTKYLARVYQFCKELGSLPEAKAISQEILNYYNPHATSSFIVNPIFVLGQEYIVEDPYYQNLLTVLRARLATTANFISESGIESLQSYLNTRGGVLNWVRDTYKNKSPAHAESKPYRKGVAKNVRNLYSNFGKQQQDELDINNLGALLYSCNVSIYGKRDEERIGYKASKYAQAEPHTIKGRSSKLKKAVAHSISLVRRFVNSNRQQIDCLLADNSGITKHEFYYELNLSVNNRIKAEAKKTYNGNVNPFWKKPLEWMTFSSSKVKKDRKEKLNRLMTELTDCKTEDSYIAFLYNALDVLVTSSSKDVEHHIYDYHYKAAIVNACREVVKRHILRGDKFGLDFNIEQLLLAEKILRALHLRDDPIYVQLTALITKKEDSEKDKLNEKKVDTSQEMEDKLAEKYEQAYEKDKQRKIDSFKTTLLAKLESSILADIVISTGRFMLKDKDIGLIGQGLSLVLANANLPGAAAAGAIIRTVSHTIDDARQQQQGQAVSSQVASYKGAFSLWWNDIVLVAVNRLADMFADEFGRMQSQEDASRFAEFCYARIYAAIKNVDASTLADLDMADYLVASVFTGNQKLNWIPGRKDHYRRTGDTSYFPSTTFQGLVDNVGFKCEKSQDAKEKDQAPQATKDIYLNMRSLKVYGGKGKERSKLAKYGVCNGSETVAIKVGRYKLTTEEGERKVSGKNIETRLAKSMHLVYGKKQEQAKTQEEFITSCVAPAVTVK